MNELLELLRATFPHSVPVSVALEAVEIATDLRHGSGYLGEENRARIGLAIEQAKNGGRS